MPRILIVDDDPLDANAGLAYQHTILVVDDEPETSELLRVVIVN